MIKIFISGKKGAGKDTFCEFIKNGFTCAYIKKQNITSKSFADPVKKIAKILFPQIPDAHLYGPSQYRSKYVTGLKLDNKPVTVRDVLIDIGQNFKKYDQGIFVRIFNEDYSHLYSLDDENVFFVTDVRFPAELEYLQRQGFIGIRITRDSAEKLDTESETALDHISDNEFDFVVKNDSDLNDLCNSALDIVDEILDKI